MAYPEDTVERARRSDQVSGAKRSAFDDYDWIARLTGPANERDDAVQRLHTLLLRASWRQLNSMADAARLGEARCNEIVQASTDEAVVAVLSRLGSFEGRSRFTTWAYKFALLQTATTIRREVWRKREAGLIAAANVPSPLTGPESHTEAVALAEAMRWAIAERLTPNQREVLVALVLRSTPIDVVAEQRGTTRNAIYKTLHDARKRLRQHLIEQGFIEPAPPKDPNR